MMNQKEIQDLIKFVSKSGVTEVEIEEKDFKITIKSEKKKEEQTVYVQQPMSQAMPQQQMPQAPAQQAQQASAPSGSPAQSAEKSKSDAEPKNDNLIEIKSPMIGTFYRSPSPDKPLFVEVGDSIKSGQTVCIIEAMKLFNEIESEVSGKIVKVLVDDATPVEYDQPLFLVDPS